MLKQLKVTIYSIIARMAWLDKIVTSVRDYSSYKQYSRKGTFSQHGEDHFFKDYFGDMTGTYIDIGASHPFRISNTFLLYTKGWKGVVVEPIERLAKLHKKWRPRDVQCNVALSDKMGN